MCDFVFSSLHAVIPMLFDGLNLVGLGDLRTFNQKRIVSYGFYCNFTVQIEAGYTAQWEDYITLAIRHAVNRGNRAESNGTALLPDT